MENAKLPEDCAKQWELILLLLSSEEKNIDKTGENEIDMMAYFYNNEAVRKILYQWLWQMRATSTSTKSKFDTSTKSDNISMMWRQKGNEMFRINNMPESYKCYTKSVLYARRDSDTFALALANRSATLLRFKRYKECLTDTVLALECGYPDEHRHKLYLRQADSHIELKNIQEAKAALDLAAQQVHNLKLSPATRGDLEKNIMVLGKKLKSTVVNPAEDASEDVPDCFLGPNQKFANASAVLELRKNESSGRHVVTNTDVQRGNILFVEDPYAFVALPVDSLLPIVCENCCESYINIVPCCICSRSVYCSEQCRVAGWQRFHRWECVGAQSRLWPTIGIAHLALRVLLNSTHNGFPATNLELSKAVKASDVFESYTNVDSIEVYRSDGDAFFRMFQLVTNFDKTSNTDYIQYALTAVMLTVYLEVHTKYFDYLPSKLPAAMSEGEMRVFVAGLLLRHMGQLVCNGHAVMALSERPDGQRTSSERETRLATAIYPAASMMNHSCDPNIINSFQRCRLVVKASRAVEAGGEVYNCYGPAYTREPMAHRRAQLRAQYHFTCACPACTDPDKKDFILLFTAYSCHACKGPVLVHNKKPCCKQCKSTALNLDRTLALLQHADDLLKEAELASTATQRCEKLLAALKLKQQALHRHHTALRDITDRLACLYAEQGEWGRSAEMIKQCVPTVEYQFGSHSVEVAHELRKLADVMLARLLAQPVHTDIREWCLETNKITKKALQLLEQNYGSWDEACQRLRANEQQVRALLAQQPPAAQRDPSVHDLLHYNLKI